MTGGDRARDVERAETTIAHLIFLTNDRTSPSHQAESLGAFEEAGALEVVQLVVVGEQVRAHVMCLRLKYKRKKYYW